MKTLCTVPYGRILAEKVATHLLNGNSIAYCHRDYCGMGLGYCQQQKKFAYGQVYDGMQLQAQQSWNSKEKFIQWLQQCTDDSLSGKEQKQEFYRYNQRITRERLEHLAGQFKIYISF